MAPERCVIGVDIGGTKVAAALVRGRLPDPGSRTPAEFETPEIVDRFTMLTDAGSSEATVRCIEECIAGVAGDAHAAEGIGVGVASMVDFAAGRVVQSVNLPLADVPLRDRLQRRFDLPVVIDNDATVAAIGEHTFGAGVGTERHDHAHAGHRGGGRRHQRRPHLARFQRRGRRAGPHHHRRRWTQVPGQLPQLGLP